MNKNDSELLILGLHRVGAPPSQAKIRGLFISPSLLSFELSLIQKMGFRFVTLRQAMENPHGKNAVLTFDDGYTDNLTHALPVLKQFGAPATVFVITGDVGKKNVVWREAGDDLPADMMDWKTLEYLQKQGWEIGSHASEHVHLARYGEEKQEKIIARSLEDLKKNLGIVPVSFAYPYGSYSETTKRIVRRLGLKYAVTIKESRLEEKLKDADLLELTRCSLGGRKFHHYLKSIARTSKAVGRSNILKSLLTPSTLTEDQKNAILLSYPADNDVMP